MRQKIRFGLDVCPATKNMTYQVHCKNCDFRVSDRSDCCECKFGNIAAPKNKRRG